MWAKCESQACRAATCLRIIGGLVFRFNLAQDREQIGAGSLPGAGWSGGRRKRERTICLEDKPGRVGYGGITPYDNPVSQRRTQ
jgi:predicted aspartyl protease